MRQPTRSEGLDRALAPAAEHLLGMETRDTLVKLIGAYGLELGPAEDARVGVGLNAAPNIWAQSRDERAERAAELRRT